MAENPNVRFRGLLSGRVHTWLQHWSSAPPPSTRTLVLSLRQRTAADHRAHPFSTCTGLLAAMFYDVNSQAFASFLRTSGNSKCVGRLLIVEARLQLPGADWIPEGRVGWTAVSQWPLCFALLESSVRGTDPGPMNLCLDVALGMPTTFPCAVYPRANSGKVPSKPLPPPEKRGNMETDG